MLFWELAFRTTLLFDGNKHQCLTLGLYLISTVDKMWLDESNLKSANALSGLYLISTVPLQKPRFYAVFRACFCGYLSEYSDNSRFFVHVNILDIFNEVYLPSTLY